MSKFVDMVKKTVDHGKEALDEFLDTLPSDDQLQEKVAGIITAVGKKVKKVDEKCAAELEKLVKSFQGSPQDSCWQELQDSASKIKDDIKNSSIFKSFKEFLSAVGKFAKSVISTKGVDESWKELTKSAKNLSKAISKSVDTTMSR